MGTRTVGDVMAELARACGRAEAPDRAWLGKLCEWPPDAFALAALVLGESGAYRRCVSPPADHRWPPQPRDQWSKHLREVPRLWMTAVLPLEVDRLLDVLDSHRSTSLQELANPESAWELNSALLQLMALADETCAGMGLFIPDYEDDEDRQFFITIANDQLADAGSLCFEIPPDYLRVVPKRHTPQSGLSLRSLSLNLALIRGEVAIKWQVAQNTALPRAGRLNLLIAPWPSEITPVDFKEVPREQAEKALDMDPQRFGFFDFNPAPSDEPERLGKLVEAAKRRAGFIDAVVLPECALHERQLERLQQVLKAQEVPLYLTGVRGSRRNSAYLNVRERDVWTPSDQNKHYRWYLDRSQIETYGLGGALHPTKRWWENIDVGPRRLHFVTPADWLTLCHLVCEDLARQDPVAHAVRAVGPTLVIALLLDGPQHRDRWAARYATVLADDPGSSVLTVTSLGMALRSVPPGRSPSRVIALWKDAGSAAREIELAPHADGVVLSICGMDDEEEYSADGRSSGRIRTRAILAGVEQVSLG